MVSNRFSSLLFFSLLAPSALAASANDWRSRSIYQVVTDRFARDDGTTPVCDPQDRKYCGGTWKGITGKLDYIQTMGFDAVWISPVVANVNGTTAYGEAYHGYWTSDLNALNTNYGTADDLKALSSALHSRGMYLMVDVVVNHFVPSNGSGIDPTTNLNTTFDFRSVTPFNATSDYHPYCIINDYTNQTDVEQCWLGDDKLPLPDLNTEDPNNVNAMYDWIQNLVQTYSFDGVRIDTVKHVRKDFWPGFRDKAGVFTIGEVLDDDPVYTGDYTKVLDAVLDYPTYFPLFTSFISPSGNLSALIDLATRSQSAYANASSVAGSFLENHDQVRFQSAQKDMALVKNAMTWPFIQDGIPILYYGQEQGYAGGADPGNREALWSSNYNAANPLYAHAKALNAARKAAITSNSNFFGTPAKFIALSSSTTSNPSTIAVSKPPLLTLLTNAGSNASDVSWTITKDQNLFQKGEKVVDLLTCQTLTADSDGGLTVKASGANPQVLIPVSDLSKSSGICPDAASGKSSGAAQFSSLGFKPAFAFTAIALGFMFL